MIAYASLLDGTAGTAVRLTLLRAKGEKPFDVTLTRRTVHVPAQVTARRLSSGYGYIALNRWKEPAHEQFRQALETLQDAPGLIIDLRGNGGGSPAEVSEVGGYFFPHKVSFGKFIRRSGKPVDLSAGRNGGQLYDGPVVILVDEGSGSGSELFAGVMQESGRAVVIGRQSCGCLLAATRKKLKGGGELGLSEFDYVTPKGRRLEGDGVLPEKAVTLKLADLRQRRDVAMEEAEKLLHGNGEAITAQRQNRQRNALQ